MGLSFVPVTIASLTGVERADAGVASGLINTSRQIGGAIGHRRGERDRRDLDEQLRERHAAVAVASARRARPRLPDGALRAVGLLLAGALIVVALVGPRRAGRPGPSRSTRRSRWTRPPNRAATAGGAAVPPASRVVDVPGPLAEVRLEAPEVVEMLARPEQHQRGLDRLLVAPRGGVADAREQAAASLGVADVRRRHRPVVHERVAERDVPRLERVELARRGSRRSARARARRPPCARARRATAQRGGRAPRRRRALRRPRRRTRRGALGEVLAKGVVEAVEGRVRGARRRGRRRSEPPPSISCRAVATT